MEGKTRIKEIERQMFILGFTAASLAETTGVSKLTISNILLGKQLPLPETSELLAKALKMKVVDFRAAIYDAQQPQQQEQQSA